MRIENLEARDSARLGFCRSSDALVDARGCADALSQAFQIFRLEMWRFYKMSVMVFELLNLNI